MTDTNTQTAPDESSSSNKPIFREKSLNRMGFSQELHSYLKGSGRTSWMALIAIVLIIAAIVVWASLTSPEYLVEILFG